MFASKEDPDGLGPSEAMHIPDREKWMVHNRPLLGDDAEPGSSSAGHCNISIIHSMGKKQWGQRFWRALQPWAGLRQHQTFNFKVKNFSFLSAFAYIKLLSFLRTYLPKGKPHPLKSHHLLVSLGQWFSIAKIWGSSPRILNPLPNNLYYHPSLWALPSAASPTPFLPFLRI